MRYGNLIAISPTRKNNRVAWNCICDCGTKTVTDSGALGCGNSSSCGTCNRKSSAKNNGKNLYKHGESHTPLHNCWSSIIGRTSFQELYNDVVVCDEWKEYTNFAEWARKNGWKQELTIERKDNNKGYNPDNCTFATRAEQSRNRTSTKLNWDKVNIIREKCKENIPQTIIAKQFNVCQQTISDINVGRRWAGV